MAFKSGDEEDEELFGDDLSEDEDAKIEAAKIESMNKRRASTFKKTESVKFIDDLFRVESRSTILETSLSLGDQSAVYDGNPNESNYFGEAARTKFFLLYNQ